MDGIRFCDKCGALLVPKKDKKGTVTLNCPNGHIQASLDDPNSYAVREKIHHDPSDRVVIIEDDEEALPTSTEFCSKCNKVVDVYFWESTSTCFSYSFSYHVCATDIIFLVSYQCDIITFRKLYRSLAELSYQFLVLSKIT